MARRAAAQKFPVGGKAVFKGYSEVNDDPILTKGEVVEVVREGKDEGNAEVRFVKSVENEAAGEEMCYLDELTEYTEPKPRQGGRRRSPAKTDPAPAQGAEIAGDGAPTGTNGDDLPPDPDPEDPKPRGDGSTVVKCPKADVDLVKGVVTLVKGARMVWKALQKF